METFTQELDWCHTNFVCTAEKESHESETERLRLTSYHATNQADSISDNETIERTNKPTSDVRMLDKIIS